MKSAKKMNAHTVCWQCRSADEDDNIDIAYIDDYGIVLYKIARHRYSYSISCAI